MKYFMQILTFILIISNSNATIWNSPYSAKEEKKNTLFSSFSLPPKHFDPVISYSASEWGIISQIYEPPLQYKYLKKPYELEPLTLKSMPTIIYLDKNGSKMDENSTNIAYSKYILNLREDIKYQNHPAFIKEYRHLSLEELADIDSIGDFKKSSTRNLKAQDYEYAIKRMAVRANHSPILDIMNQYIIGLKDFSKEISKIAQEKKKSKEIFDLSSYHIKGVEVIDDYTLSITIKGKYPQFLYWLSMNFFAPIPWEADIFYQQKGLIKKNITLNTYPIGTGAYYLSKNNPNREMILKANPNFHTEYFKGEKLPFIKKVIYSLEKESIPFWNKFLQGYYDSSGVSSEAFDQAISISSNGDMGISDNMKKQGIKMSSAISPSIFYLAFNMADPIVGGYSKEAQKLRQAISIAQNEEEYISIFMNGRGIPAQSPIPPGIFGYQEGKEGTNFVVYDWINGKRVRKPIEVAKKLLSEAGYPNGISKKSGKQLVLYYDTTSRGPDDRALMNWRRKQFAKLGIELIIRATDYNRFQDKIRKGKAQLFSWGWNADYPDPENFLFLLYGKNATIKTGGAGINSSNYQNPKFDKLFEEIKTMKNSPKRLEKIREMIKILQIDAPWVWGIHPKSLMLYHSWYSNIYPNAMAQNTLKYRKINGKERYKKIKEWNKPVIMPLILFFVFLIVMGYILYKIYQNRQKAIVY
jgi:ABC-type transport system substrate-binding protein